MHPYQGVEPRTFQGRLGAPLAKLLRNQYSRGVLVLMGPEDAGWRLVQGQSEALCTCADVCACACGCVHVAHVRVAATPGWFVGTQG